MTHHKNANTPPALHVDSLTTLYDRTPVLWDIHFSIPQGHLVGIIGPNGAGKTTLISSCLKLVKPLSGQVLFLDKPLEKARKKIAYIPQKEAIDWHFPITVEELVLMGSYTRKGLFKWFGNKEKNKAKALLEKMGLKKFASRQIDELSGGQKQRAFLARALMQDADIYFMDEPFTGVDAVTESLIIDMLKEMRDDGKTIFIVHHDLNTLQSYFDWIIILNKRLIACGPTEKVLTKENLQRAYGSIDPLLQEAMKLSEKTKAGLRTSKRTST